MRLLVAAAQAECGGGVWTGRYVGAEHTSGYVAVVAGDAVLHADESGVDSVSRPRSLSVTNSLKPLCVMFRIWGGEPLL